jgi:hypothetical protein
MSEDMRGEFNSSRIRGHCKSAPVDGHGSLSEASRKNNKKAGRTRETERERQKERERENESEREREKPAFCVDVTLPESRQKRSETPLYSPAV